jgi:hypothetical protein
MSTPEHSLLTIIECPGKSKYHIYKNSAILFSESLEISINEKFPNGLGTRKQPITLTGDELRKLIKQLDEVLKSHEDESTNESSDDEEETIQRVLAHRIKSQSSQKSIVEENISDSENEDVISHSRRFRHLYSEIKHLKTKINNLIQN